MAVRLPYAGAMRDFLARGSSLSSVRHANLESDMTLQPPRIIIAEDEAIFRQILLRMFQYYLPGCEFVVARHGREALDAHQSRHATLLITDQRMPEYSGSYLIDALRSRTATPPIILMTGESQFNQRAIGVHVLYKPFEIVVLVELALTLVPDLQRYASPLLMRQVGGSARPR
jgi:CheY-like chemotaxis protein